jgi:hypothetical protein
VRLYKHFVNVYIIFSLLAELNITVLYCPSLRRNFTNKNASSHCQPSFLKDMNEAILGDGSAKLTMEQKLELWLKAKRNAIKASTTDDRVTPVNKGSATKSALRRSTSDPFKKSLVSAEKQPRMVFDDSFGSPTTSDDSKENTPNSENVVTAPLTNGDGKSPKALFQSPNASSATSTTKTVGTGRQSMSNNHHIVGGNSFRDRLESVLQTQQKKSSTTTKSADIDIDDEDDTYFSPLSVSRCGTMKVAKSKTQPGNDNSLASREPIARVGNRLSEKTGAEIAAMSGLPVGSLSSSGVSVSSIAPSINSVTSASTTANTVTADALRKALQDLEEMSSKLVDVELRDSELRAQLAAARASVRFFLLYR